MLPVTDIFKKQQYVGTIEQHPAAEFIAGQVLLRPQHGAQLPDLVALVQRDLEFYRHRALLHGHSDYAGRGREATVPRYRLKVAVRLTYTRPTISWQLTQASSLTEELKIRTPRLHVNGSSTCEPSAKIRARVRSACTCDVDF